MKMKKLPIALREIGGPPLDDEDELIAWIARRAGRTEAEVRTARRRSTERRGRVAQDADGVRAAVAAALVDPTLVPDVADAIGRGFTPAAPSRRTRRKAHVTTSITTTSDPHRARADLYGGSL